MRYRKHMASRYLDKIICLDYPTDDLIDGGVFIVTRSLGGGWIRLHSNEHGAIGCCVVDIDGTDISFMRYDDAGHQVYFTGEIVG